MQTIHLKPERLSIAGRRLHMFSWRFSYLHYNPASWSASNSDVKENSRQCHFFNKRANCGYKG